MKRIETKFLKNFHVKQIVSIGDIAIYLIKMTNSRLVANIR